MSFWSRRISRLARANLNNNHSIPPRLNSEQFLSNLEEARVYTRRTVATLAILLSGKGFKCVLDRQPFFPQELLVHGWNALQENELLYAAECYRNALAIVDLFEEYQQEAMALGLEVEKELNTEEYGDEMITCLPKIRAISPYRLTPKILNQVVNTKPFFPVEHLAHGWIALKKAEKAIKTGNLELSKSGLLYVEKCCNNAEKMINKFFYKWDEYQEEVRWLRIQSSRLNG